MSFNRFRAVAFLAAAVLTAAVAAAAYGAQAPNIYTVHTLVSDSADASLVSWRGLPSRVARR